MEKDFPEPKRKKGEENALEYNFLITHPFKKHIFILFLLLQEHVSEQHDMLFQRDRLLFGQGISKQKEKLSWRFLSVGTLLGAPWNTLNTQNWMNLQQGLLLSGFERGPNR